MVEGTFGSDGELKKTGPTDLKVAEGLGGSNIKGVEDAKTKKDAEKDTGREIPDEHINTSNQYPRVGTDPASMFVILACMRTGMLSHLTIHMSRFVSDTAGNETVMIDAPESGRTNQGQGNNTSTGRADYIDQSRQGAK